MTSAATRAYAPFEPAWSRFHEFAAPLASSSGAGAAASVGESAQNSHPYNRQYSHVYSARLKLLRRRCIQNAQQSLKDDGVDAADVVERIIEVKEGALSILVGTIVKEMDPKRRPPVKSTDKENTKKASSNKLVKPIQTSNSPPNYNPNPEKNKYSAPPIVSNHTSWQSIHSYAYYSLSDPHRTISNYSVSLIGLMPIMSNMFVMCQVRKTYCWQ
eukprot:scaffold12157_cov78-Skeletonema_dohrnii-CCMP3373.AAC.1